MMASRTWTHSRDHAGGTEGGKDKGREARRQPQAGSHEGPPSGSFSSSFADRRILFWTQRTKVCIQRERGGLQGGGQHAMHTHNEISAVQ